MAVNQKQIAERLGVSIAVVSRSLSGTAREIGIAQETIERVQKVAREMGYVPNVAAQTLKGKASNTLGVVVYDFLDPFFGSMLEQLQKEVHQEGYSLILVGFSGRHPSISDLTPLHKHVIDGLIVLGSAAGNDWLNGFKHLPVVRIGHGEPADHGICVAIDDLTAADQLLEHLISRGSRRYCFIGSNLYGHDLRYEAFKRVADSKGIQLERLVSSEDGFTAGLRSAETLLAENREPAALVCATDMIAMGALHALRDSGAQWPVTGFDDIPAAGQFMPSITTVRQPVEDIAHHAVKSIANPGTATSAILPGRLIVRESTQECL